MSGAVREISQELLFIDRLLIPAFEDKNEQETQKKRVRNG